MNTKLLHIILAVSFLIFSGMSCDDDKLREELARKDVELQRERKRAENAEAERKKKLIIARTEKEELNGKAEAEKIRRQWSDNYAMIICLGFCISLLNLWRIRHIRKRREENREVL